MTTKEVKEILKKETRGLNLNEEFKNFSRIFTYYDAEDMMEELYSEQRKRADE